MVDKTQLISIVAEGMMSAASSADAIASLHPVRVMLSSSVAKIASYSILVIAAGYTTGILFEKVFPNMPSFKRHVLGLRRTKKTKRTTPVAPNQTSASGRSKAAPAVAQTQLVLEQCPSATLQQSTSENSKSDQDYVPIFALPSFTKIWATACALAQPITRRFHPSS